MRQDCLQDKGRNRFMNVKGRSILFYGVQLYVLSSDFLINKGATVVQATKDFQSCAQSFYPVYVLILIILQI